MFTPDEVLAMDAVPVVSENKSPTKKPSTPIPILLVR